MTLALEIAWQRFGFLIAQRRLIGDKLTSWECLCDCGVSTIVRLSNLRSGNTTSCGCQKYKNRKSGRVPITSLPEYKSWDGMRQRCRNPKDAGYSRYGGRGITVCDRWDSFSTFLTDMGPKPSPKHSIERKDNNGPYSPDNCRWATTREQSVNRRSNVSLTAFGRTQVLMDWAREVGINHQTISARIAAGWPTEVALTAPQKHGHRNDITSI